VGICSAGTRLPRAHPVVEIETIAARINEKLLASLWKHEIMLKLPRDAAAKGGMQASILGRCKIVWAHGIDLFMDKSIALSGMLT
jgi:hypothetical protein